MSTLTKEDKEKFWIRCYLSPTTDLTDAAIDRAYRDFNRTLHGISKNQTIENHNELKMLIRNFVTEALTETFLTQTIFDKWHERKCNELITSFKNISRHKLFVGQAQKWINMTLKYLFALGDERINGISRNYQFFHIPIDNIIQVKLSKSEIPKLKDRWSRINNYSEYLNYQEMVRTKFSGQIPMDVEFRLFNEL
jgi:hypothetical protein